MSKSLLWKRPIFGFWAVCWTEEAIRRHHYRPFSQQTFWHFTVGTPVLFLPQYVEMSAVKKAHLVLRDWDGHFHPFFNHKIIKQTNKKLKKQKKIMCGSPSLDSSTGVCREHRVKRKYKEERTCWGCWGGAWSHREWQQKIKKIAVSQQYREEKEGKKRALMRQFYRAREIERWQEPKIEKEWEVGGQR